MRTFSLVVLTSFSIFFTSSYLFYKTGINNLYIQSEDSIPAMFLPITIIRERTFYADSYYSFIRARYPHPDDKNFDKNLTPFYFRKIIDIAKPHYITAFPVVTGLLALPVFLLPLLFGMTVTWWNLAVLSHITASVVVSLSGGFLYVLLKRHFNLSEFKSILLTTVYLFGTINFALVSQSLWQHGTLELLTVLGLLLLYESFSSNEMRTATSNASCEPSSTVQANTYLFLSMVSFGFAVLSRPTSFLFLPFIFLLVIERWKSIIKPLLVSLLGFIPALVFFYWYNSTYYFSIQNQGYSNQVLVGWLSRFPEGFLGLWLSPSKGILIYSPIFLFSFIGLWLVVRKGMWKTNLQYIVFASIVLLHTMLLGRWKHWYGGWSFGYRMASDVIPFLILLMIPYIQSSLYEKTKKWFYLLFGISVGIEALGIIFFDGIWHAAYDRGFRDTSWLWSVKDSELMFNVRRILVKFRIIEKACLKC